MSATRSRDIAGFLKNYFLSGWAFLLPYLGVYLVYEKMAWPVQTTIYASASATSLPSLVTLFDAMHALHLGALGWIGYGFYRQPLWPERWPRIVSWLLLFVLMLVPGLYLEFPADTWSHVERIHAWSGLDLIYQHYWWTKFSYFGAYTLLRHFDPELSLPVLGVLAASCSLGLAWQYYRLARSLQYSTGASFTFALLQWVMLGNSAFSFDRYYGVSSTIIAQIAAIAAIRILVDLLPPPSTSTQATAGSEPRRWGIALAALLGIFILTYYNHVQAMAIALLGMAGVVACSLHQRRPIWLVSISAAAVCASMLLAFNPSLISTPHDQSILQPWLGASGGFNLFDWGSLAGQRAWQVLGGFGMGAIFLAVPLCWRYHATGWLCLFPVGVLLLPATALTYTIVNIRLRGSDDINVYSRLFFAVPMALPYVHWLSKLGEHKNMSDLRWLFITTASLSLIVLPPSYPWHNRLWHAIAIIPDDLALRPVWDAVGRLGLVAGQPPPVYATNGGTGYVFATRHAGQAPWRRRLADSPMPAGTKADDFAYLCRSMENPSTPAPAAFMVVQATASYTSTSLAALCAGHWQPQEALLAVYSGGPQLRGLALQYGYSRKSLSGDMERYEKPLLTTSQQER